MHLTLRPTIAALLLLGMTAGCAGSLFGRRPATSADPAMESARARLRRVYADLSSGRFRVIADFSTVEQARGFRVPSAGGVAAEREQPSVSLLHGRDETGAGALRATLGRSDTLELASGDERGLGSLPADWQPYALLLMSIHGPPDGLRVELTVRGADGAASWSRTLAVQPGWSLQRIDLGDVAQQIDLAHVGSLVWRLPDAAEPTPFLLDDLVLVDNSRTVLGNPEREGELYVLERGRRLCVGCGGRFELAFSAGVIVGWNEPGRPNLTVPTGLGPWPVPLPDDWSRGRAAPVAYDDPALYAAWGERVSAAQTLAESSPLRAVVRGWWRFSTPAEGDAPAASGPEHSWRYTIYPSGAVYVWVSSESAGRGWSGPRVGYAVALDARFGFQRVGPEPAYSEQAEAVRFALLSQAGADRPDLLWVPFDRALAARQVELVTSDERRLALTLGDVAAEERVESAHLLRFWPRDLDQAPEGEVCAGDYQHPAEIELLRGALAAGVAGDLDGDGFNESEGCHELRLDDNLLRFRLKQGRWLRHASVVRVHGTTGRRCWVYADGRIVDTVERDGEGRLLIALPEFLSSEPLIEVTAR
ncbi:MAG: hypothetical protein HRF50_05455 [Phycisphaerae bacterium]|jgi:hypothetical protein